MRWLLSLVLILCPAVASAQIAFGSISAGAQGTTSLSIAYPSGISAGDLLVVCIGNKYPTNGPTEPSGDGFASVAGGQGSGGPGGTGVDTGDAYATVYVKVASGSESGSLAVTVTSGNASYGFMARYTKTSGTWGYAATNGSNNTHDTSWSVTGAADPGVQSGDLMVVCSGKNSENATFNAATSVTQAGVTYAALNERGDNGTSFGDDVGAVVIDAAATAGTSSGAPGYTSTLGANGAGASVFLRLREVASGGCTGGLLLLGAGKC
jgi:MSHA biogenesis protein MshQ